MSRMGLFRSKLIHRTEAAHHVGRGLLHRNSKDWNLFCNLSKVTYCPMASGRKTSRLVNLIMAGQ